MTDPDARKRSKATEGVQLVVYLVCMGYALHPGTFDEHQEIVKSWVGRQLHKLSVYQALAAIRSLPETRSDPD